MKFSSLQLHYLPSNPPTEGYTCRLQSFTSVRSAHMQYGISFCSMYFWIPLVFIGCFLLHNMSSCTHAEISSSCWWALSCFHCRFRMDVGFLSLLQMPRSTTLHSYPSVQRLREFHSRCSEGDVPWHLAHPYQHLVPWAHWIIDVLIGMEWKLGVGGWGSWGFLTTKVQKTQVFLCFLFYFNICLFILLCVGMRQCTCRGQRTPYKSGLSSHCVRPLFNVPFPNPLF